MLHQGFFSSLQDRLDLIDGFKAEVDTVDQDVLLTAPQDAQVGNVPVHRLRGTRNVVDKHSCVAQFGSYRTGDLIATVDTQSLPAARSSVADGHSPRREVGQTAGRSPLLVAGPRQ